MHYVFIDTNIFIRVMSQGKPGCETELFERLQVLVTGGALTLLIPEIVLNELIPVHGPQDLDAKYSKLNKHIQKIHVWSEIKDTEQFLLEYADKLRDEKKQHWQDMHEKILAFLRSKDVSLIPYDDAIKRRASERISQRKMPRLNNNDDNVDNDAAIIESLVTYFSCIEDPQPVLLFCSENIKDFAIRCTKSAPQDPEYKLHPILAADLPEMTHYFTQLDDLLQLDLGYESLPELTVDKELQEAMDRAELLGSKCNFDWDSKGFSGYIQAEEHLVSIKHARLASQYVAELLPAIHEEFQNKRDDIVNIINNLIRQCRRCISWNGKSEEKLCYSLENVPEAMIPFTSLSNLLKIEKNLQQYLLIHKGMDGDIKNV